MTRKNVLLGVVGLMLAATLIVFSQTSSQFPELDKNGKPVLPRPMPHVIYSPVDLAHSAATLPAGAGNPTPNTNIIRLGDVTKMTVFVNCTQTADLWINVYTADDQSQPSPNFTVYGTYSLVTGVAAGAQQIYLASELAPNTTVGSVVTNIRLPQLAVSFFEKNTTATAGTCTDRVIVGY
jgi:hypothetical protein